MESKEIAFQRFKTRRSNILKHIDNFLRMVLSFFTSLPDSELKKLIHSQNIDIGKSFSRCLESLCQIHALYGYPGKSELVNPNAIKDVVLDMKENGKKFKDYCSMVEEKKFWKFKFHDGKLKWVDLTREPAYMFLQMVNEVLPVPPGNEDRTAFGLFLLSGLKKSNSLRPKVWAENKANNTQGVSLAVDTFVRPLYLCIKLQPLISAPNDDQNAPHDRITAYKLINEDKAEGSQPTENNEEERKRIVKPPCVTCEIVWGKPCFHPIGSCAEYDVTLHAQKLREFFDENSLRRSSWDRFKSKCEVQLQAFNTFIQSTSVTDEETLRNYFDEAQNTEPKVLKCCCVLTEDKCEL